MTSRRSRVMRDYQKMTCMFYSARSIYTAWKPFPFPFLGQHMRWLLHGLLVSIMCHVPAVTWAGFRFDEPTDCKIIRSVSFRRTCSMCDIVCCVVSLNIGQLLPIIPNDSVYSFILFFFLPTYLSSCTLTLRENIDIYWAWCSIPFMYYVLAWIVRVIHEYIFLQNLKKNQRKVCSKHVYNYTTNRKRTCQMNLQALLILT